MLSNSRHFKNSANMRVWPPFHIAKFAVIVASAAIYLAPMGQVSAQPLEFCGGHTPTIWASPGVKTVGTNGRDIIMGTSGPDEILALGGNDLVCGQGGNDVIHGNAGNDDLRGANGNDKLFGGAGNDTIYGGNGNDRVHGQGGNDKLYGNAGWDVLNGYAGDDRLEGGPGHDKLFGGPGKDAILGDAGNDTLQGGPGNDTLRGGDQLDHCNGGTENDRQDGCETSELIEICEIGSLDESCISTYVGPDTAYVLHSPGESNAGSNNNSTPACVAIGGDASKVPATIRGGESFTLAPGARVTFRGHSSKPTDPNPDESTHYRTGFVAWATATVPGEADQRIGWSTPAWSDSAGWPYTSGDLSFNNTTASAQTYSIKMSFAAEKQQGAGNGYLTRTNITGDPQVACVAPDSCGQDYHDELMSAFSGAELFYIFANVPESLAGAPMYLFGNEFVSPYILEPTVERICAAAIALQ